MRIFRKSVVVALMVSAAGGATVLVAAPAHASPQNCRAEFVYRNHETPLPIGARSVCDGGSGSHRIGVSCQRPGTNEVIRHGQWVGTLDHSYMFCDRGTSVAAAWVDKQGD